MRPSHANFRKLRVVPNPIYLTFLPPSRLSSEACSRHRLEQHVNPKPKQVTTRANNEHRAVLSQLPDLRRATDNMKHSRDKDGHGIPSKGYVLICTYVHAYIFIHMWVLLKASFGIHTPLKGLPATMAVAQMPLL